MSPADFGMRGEYERFWSVGGLLASYHKVTLIPGHFVASVVERAGRHYRVLDTFESGDRAELEAWCRDEIRRRAGVEVSS